MMTDNVTNAALFAGWEFEEPHYIPPTTDGSCMAGPTDGRWRQFARRKSDGHGELGCGPTREEAMASCRQHVIECPNDADTIFLNRLRPLLQYGDKRPAIALCRNWFSNRNGPSNVEELAKLHFENVTLAQEKTKLEAANETHSRELKALRAYLRDKETWSGLSSPTLDASKMSFFDRIRFVFGLAEARWLESACAMALTIEATEEDKAAQACELESPYSAGRHSGRAEILRRWARQISK